MPGHPNQSGHITRSTANVNWMPTVKVQLNVTCHSEDTAVRTLSVSK